MEQRELIPHLFRNESGRMISVLTRFFGMDSLQLAEDITAETFLAALETWPYNGIPANPAGWLHTVARNKAMNILAHEKVFQEKVSVALRASADLFAVMDVDLSDSNIADSQLRMLFAICHPSLAPEAQIALALRILCGFGIDEIANAFLTNKETINKRLQRAKSRLREENISLDFPGVDVWKSRLSNVLATLYLLFSEGYYSETNESIIRKDFCLEAMRLTLMLTRNETTNIPEANVLLALMCFQSSRFEARGGHGEMILYEEQDRALWDQHLIAEGAKFLHASSRGDLLTSYHLEASIAYWYTVIDDNENKWGNILHLYNLLLQTSYSPIAALNRTYALAKVKGNEIAIREAEQLKLDSNQYYFALLGELYSSVDKKQAKINFQRAIELCRRSLEKQQLTKKLDALDSE